MIRWPIFKIALEKKTMADDHGPESMVKWHKGKDFQLFPTMEQLKKNRGKVIRECLMRGHAPPKPVIKKTDRVFVAGSCFARQIALRVQQVEDKWGNFEKNDLHIFADAFGNAFVMLRYIEWALGRKSITNAETMQLSIYDPKRRPRRGRHLVKVNLDEKARESVAKSIGVSDAFVLALGLAELWMDKKADEVFIRAVNVEKYDPERHCFKLTNVAENKKCISDLVAALRSVCPNAPIVLTMTPQRLRATFGKLGSIGAETLNKAILRVAIDEYMKESADSGVYYWPAYEIVKECWGPAVWREDGRHLSAKAADEVVGVLKRYYIEG